MSKNLLQPKKGDRMEVHQKISQVLPLIPIATTLILGTIGHNLGKSEMVTPTLAPILRPYIASEVSNPDDVAHNLPGLIGRVAGSVLGLAVDLTAKQSLKNTLNQ